MRITLIQSEIETAIINYINAQVNVREGMSIVVDLSATRGENGFTATIDIVNAKAVKTIPQVVAPVVPIPEVVGEITEPTKEMEVVTPIPAPVQPVVNPLAALAADRPRSLFAGLQKPTNQS